MKKNKVVISVDLATRKSGIVVRYNKKVVYLFTIELDKFKNENIYYNYIYHKFNCLGGEIKRELYFKDINKIDKTDLVIELANFSKPSHTQQAAFLAGILYSQFKKIFPNVELYMFNANKWFEKFNEEFCKIKDWTHIKREQRKELSIKHFLEQEDIKELNIDWNFYTPSQLSDIADAYWIGKYYYTIGLSFKIPIVVICGNKKYEKE